MILDAVPILNKNNVDRTKTKAGQNPINNNGRIYGMS